MINENKVINSCTFFVFIYNIYKLKELRKKSFTIDEIENLMGYNKKQFGGFRRYIMFLVNKKIFTRESIFFNHPVKYLLDIKSLEEIFEKSLFYKIVYNYEIEDYYPDIPIPSQLNNYLNS